MFVHVLCMHAKYKTPAVAWYLLPVSALIPRLEHQFTVSVSAFIQALQLLDINPPVQLVFHSSFCWFMIAFATPVTVSTAVTVSRHGVNLHFQLKEKSKNSP